MMVSYDEDITKDWDNFVDQILPSRVASLFFFDGEKIEQLADLDKSKRSIKKSHKFTIRIRNSRSIKSSMLMNFRKIKFRKKQMMMQKKSLTKLNSESKSLRRLKLNKSRKKLIKEEDKLTNVKYENQSIDIELSQKGFVLL